MGADIKIDDSIERVERQISFSNRAAHICFSIINSLLKVTGKRLVLESVMRPSLKYFLDKKDVKGVEIGVAKGENAESILSNLDMKMLWLIDPYMEYYDVGKFFRYNYTMFQKAFERLSGFKNKTFIRKMSKDAIFEVPNDLDFVYIDGNHDYEYAKGDIEVYWGKIKNGGLICGADFNIPSVAKAVIEFAESNHLHIYVESKDWWMIKEFENK